jgi:hypothetical protein
MNDLLAHFTRNILRRFLAKLKCATESIAQGGFVSMTRALSLTWITANAGSASRQIDAIWQTIRYINDRDHGLMFSKRATRAIAAAGAMGLASFAVSAQSIEVQGGRSYMDSHGTDAFFVESVFDARAMGNSRFTWSPDVSLGWIDGRDSAELRKYANPSTKDAVWLLAGGARLHYGDESNWYHPLFFSFQVAGQTGRTQALSSVYEFVSTLGWQWKYLSFEIRHISNGSFQQPNRGETMALVGIRFPF